MRKWRKNFLILSLYPPSLSISYIKIGHILSQNVKYGIFVANVTYSKQAPARIEGRIIYCVQKVIIFVDITHNYFGWHRMKSH